MNLGFNHKFWAYFLELKFSFFFFFHLTLFSLKLNLPLSFIISRIYQFCFHTHTPTPPENFLHLIIYPKRTIWFIVYQLVSYQGTYMAKFVFLKCNSFLLISSSPKWLYDLETLMFLPHIWSFLSFLFVWLKKTSVIE